MRRRELLQALLVAPVALLGIRPTVTPEYEVLGVRTDLWDITWPGTPWHEAAMEGVNWPVSRITAAEVLSAQRRYTALIDRSIDILYRDMINKAKEARG